MQSTLSTFKKSTKLMGNLFEITAVGEDQLNAETQIQGAIDEIKRIEILLTTFNEDSQTNQINQAAGLRPVQVDEEVFRLIQRSLKISNLTQGAFDITYGSMDKKFWNFDITMDRLPDPIAAKESVRLINYRNVILDESDFSVFLTQKGMRIGFGGIGKGYAAEQAKRCMQASGVQAGIINASGDLCTWGRSPEGAAWTIGIADPFSRLNIFSELELKDMSVATSGDYEKYVIIDGKKYSHTIDPRSGYPVHGITSVTIISPNAELSDAMTTPVMVMGIQKGLFMINQMNGIGCILIDDHGKLYKSNNIKLN
ncbi:MAG: FAD:protein FMN transferase [Saprospiraceae bacterium]|nr:FAD:protein FMN transferase [Saprospiraceae bacterium]MBK6814356.1 FAD:protein FMN transferase [Saprospiraceae bacterium]MBK7373776.1 FAD:protein FMN transferase [Saprospiraceae bacterium]MBK7608558.1 FAD:protein FMN transferase [Saprospiraceae bacterium]MBL0111522.1 FAD:protein FMN transferase [Saprospiraceae bacterium]